MPSAVLDTMEKTKKSKKIVEEDLEVKPRKSPKLKEKISQSDSDSEEERKVKKEKKSKDKKKKKIPKDVSDSESDSEAEKKKKKKKDGKKKSKQSSDSESESDSAKSRKKDKKDKRKKDKSSKEEKSEGSKKSTKTESKKRKPDDEPSVNDEFVAEPAKESNGHAAKKQKLDNGAAAPKAASEVSPQKSVEEWRKEHSISVPAHAPPPIQHFEDPGLPEAAKKALQLLKFEKPTPVQGQSWPIAFAGRDMISIAETGSGKTLSFVLPAMLYILKQLQKKSLSNVATTAAPAQPPPFGAKPPPFGARGASFGSQNRGNGNTWSARGNGNTWAKPSPYPAGRAPLALFLAPTRELAIQINEVCEKVCASAQLSCVCVYGGAPKGPQVGALRRGVDIVVATPGRCSDLYSQLSLKLADVSFVVLDEADRMLDMGFEPQIKEILSVISKERQTMMFSATWPKEVQALAEGYLSDPIKMTVGKSGLQANRKITQHFKFSPFPERLNCLTALLDEIFKDNCKIIIFNNTKASCEEIATHLWNAGKPINVIHGDMEQNVRERALEQFKNGKYPLLVATEVAARGIDIRDIKYVVNYTMPNNVEDYVHRIGRTGRGGDVGVAYNIVCPKDSIPARGLIKLLTEAGQAVPEELEKMAGPFGGGGRGGRGGRFGRGGSSWGMRRGGFGGGRGGRGR